MEKLKLTRVLCLLLTLFANTGYTQEYKKDTRIQLQKEDSNNKYRADNITELDLLHALKMVGIQVHKFKLGDFDKGYNFYIIIDEYIDGKIAKTDTVMKDSNEYTYGYDGKKYSVDYIDQIKIMSKDDDNKSQISIFTYFMERTDIKFECKKTMASQFFAWRNYADTRWRLNEKIPLMVFASSWEDKKYNVQRFCGVVNLEENTKGTNELLAFSPHYFKISYVVTSM
jgi:hypothetical protein